MTVKLRCLGSRPLGRRPLSVARWGHRLIPPGTVVDARDETEAAILMEEYPGCFERIPEEAPIVVPVEAEFVSDKPRKALKNVKDKMLKDDLTKDFS